eukprot:3648810-Alexandrium_andersonii.AAC.1
MQAKEGSNEPQGLSLGYDGEGTEAGLETNKAQACKAIRALADHCNVLRKLTRPGSLSQRATMAAEGVQFRLQGSLS